MEISLIGFVATCLLFVCFAAALTMALGKLVIVIDLDKWSWKRK